MADKNSKRPWWAQSNRTKHIGYGMAIFGSCLAFSLLIGIGFDHSLLVGALCTTVAAVTKEYADQLHGCLFDWLDALATVMLPYLFVFLYILIKILVWLL